MNTREPFTTTIDKYVRDDFKAECAKQGVPMNTVLEKLMRDFTIGKLTFGIINNFEAQDKW